MTQVFLRKKYDLEDRTKQFAKDIRRFVRRIPKEFTNIDDLKQLIRSSGSVGANYIEANEALSKKDFIMRIKISIKESKETRYWLSLLELNQHREFQTECDRLYKEASELMNIFGSIARKSV